jgi:riboflavin-specific deaminase-like protein
MQTVRRDNPALTVRHVSGVSPYRVVLSTSLKFPRACQLVDDNSDGRMIVATSADARRRFLRTNRGRNDGLIFWDVRTRPDGLLDVRDFVARAADFGFRSLLVEGGAHLATSFLKAGLVDKFVTIVAPKLLGSGVDAVGELGIRRLTDAIRFERTEVTSLGPDTVFTGYPGGVR